MKKRFSARAFLALSFGAAGLLAACAPPPDPEVGCEQVSYYLAFNDFVNFTNASGASVHLQASGTGLTTDVDVDIPADKYVRAVYYGGNNNHAFTANLLSATGGLVDTMSYSEAVDGAPMSDLLVYMDNVVRSIHFPQGALYEKDNLMVTYLCPLSDLEEPPVATGALLLDNVVLSMESHATDVLWQENINSVQLHHPAVHDPVGTIIGSGPYTQEIGIGSDVRRPTLANTGSRASLKFDGANDFVTVRYSKRAFDFIPAGEAFSILMWVRVNADGTTMHLLDNNAATSANVGFSVVRRADNRLFVSVSNGNGSYISYTTANTDDGKLTVSDGWTLLSIVSDGSSTSLQMNDQPMEFVTAAPLFTSDLGASAAADLHIGAKSSNLTNVLNGEIGSLIITSDAITPEEHAQVLAYNPVLTSAPQGKALSTSSTLEPTELSHLHTYWDLSDDAAKFTDIAGTQQIVANSGASIGRIAEQRGYRLDRDLVAESDTKRAWNSVAAVNGLNVPHWDGVDDNYRFRSWLQGGAQTLVFVAKNDDVDHGSHFFQGSLYLVQTGENYEQGAGDEARFVVHTLDSSQFYGKLFGEGEEMDGNAWHIYTLIRDADTWHLRVDGEEAASSPYTNDPSLMSFYQMGYPNNGPVWHLDGYVSEVAKYDVAHSISDIEKLEQHLANKYDIDLVQ